MLFYRIKILFPILIFSLISGPAQAMLFNVPDYRGEIMHYRLKYGLFNIGIATISFMEDSTGYGYIIKAEAQSTGLLKIFNDLNYRFECRMDHTSGLPYSAIMDLKDKNSIVYNQVSFDQHSRIDSAIVYSQATGEHIVQKNIYDILSGYYHFRMNFLNESVNDGLPVVINTFLDDELWDLKIRYTGEESIMTMYGEQTCLRFSPNTVVGNFFQKDDDMNVWFTKDEHHIPVKIQLNLKVGSIKAELAEYHMPNLK